MNFNTFEQQFIPFCITPGFGGGKARSYYLAIRYLAEYMGLQDLSNGNVRKSFRKMGKSGIPLAISIASWSDGLNLGIKNLI